MKKILHDTELRELIKAGISTEELNSGYDYSVIKDMSYLFANCTELEIIPYIDTSNVVSMIDMFYKCGKLKSVPLLNTSNVIDMDGMFFECRNLEIIPDLDTSKCIDMDHMFDGCRKIKSIDPYRFRFYDYSRLNNKYLKDKYPELFI